MRKFSDKHKLVFVDSRSALEAIMRQSSIPECCPLVIMKLITYKSCSEKRGLNAYAKSIDSCQAAQSEQADMGQNFFFSTSKLIACQRTILLPVPVDSKTKWVLWIYK